MLRTGIGAAPTIAAVLLLCPAAWAEGGNFSHHTSCSASGCDVVAQAPGEPPGIISGETPQGGNTTSTPPPCVMPDVEFSGPDGDVLAPAGGAAECERSASTHAQPAFDPRALAEQARARLTLPVPDIGTAPAPGKPRFVNLPSWLWIDAADWEPVSVSAAVSTGAVTVVASPHRVVWATGDGGEVVCPGPGTPFSVAAHRRNGPSECSYTYTSVPPTGPGSPVDLVASWEWTVSWSASDGQSGELADLVTVSSVAVSVAELHSVVTDSR
ncbi:hypothetical protein [Nocardiopsis protaetiae]|uniref:hypothetical protein n=1 Tax=Nocardiopsis protaetiae TaxID=3382270 RepID=UPI00387AE107